MSVREHGIALAVPFVRAAAGVAGFGLATAAMAGMPSLGAWRAVPLVLAAAVALALVLRLAGAVARWHSRRLVVTDRRAVLVHGPLRRREALELDDIGSVAVDASLLGRKLHYGGVVVEVDGDEELLFGMRHVPDPDLVMALVLGLAEDAPAAFAPARMHHGAPPAVAVMR
jgi:hypothetical protein